MVDAAIKVHMALGPGLLETVYEIVLAHALSKRGLHEFWGSLNETRHNQGSKQFGGIILASLRLCARHYPELPKCSPKRGLINYAFFRFGDERKVKDKW